MNKIILIGRLTKDPELKYTKSGTAVCTFNLAVNRRFANQNGEREADFINCQAWQKTAEFIANYFKKGQLMALEGRLQVRSYDGNDNKKHWMTEVVAEQIEFVGGKNGSNSNSAGSTTGGSGYGAEPELGWGQDVPFDDNDLPF